MQKLTRQEIARKTLCQVITFLQSGADRKEWVERYRDAQGLTGKAINLSKDFQWEYDPSIHQHAAEAHKEAKEAWHELAVASDIPPSWKGQKITAEKWKEYHTKREQYHRERIPVLAQIMAFLHHGKGKAVNPWAVCNWRIGPRKGDPEKEKKFERCVLKVKRDHPLKK